MKTLQIISVLFILVATYGKMGAQVNLSTATLDANQNYTATADTLINKSASSDPLLTPEQQGFTKFVLPDNSIVYRKKAGMLSIEYKPKQ